MYNYLKRHLLFSRSFLFSFISSVNDLLEEFRDKITYSTTLDKIEDEAFVAAECILKYMKNKKKKPITTFAIASTDDEEESLPPQPVEQGRHDDHDQKNKKKKKKNNNTNTNTNPNANINNNINNNNNNNNISNKKKKTINYPDSTKCKGKKRKNNVENVLNDSDCLYSSQPTSSKVLRKRK